MKYALYEQAVQTPEQHCDLLALMYADITGKKARVLREDFCGTYLISSYWVKRDKQNRAFGLDLDPEPVTYGALRNKRFLSTAEKKRVTIKLQNVLKPGGPQSDLCVACNFSFYIFKERTALLKYFKAVRASLKKGGVFALEMTGGPGMIEETKETRTVKVERDQGGPPLVSLPRKFKYIWHQKTYDAISHECMYAISFKLPNGTLMKEAFTYDWRVWTVREVREVMEEAGFSRSVVYWDMHKPPKDKRLGDHEYGRTEVGENYYAWICYVAGVK